MIAVLYGEGGAIKDTSVIKTIRKKPRKDPLNDLTILKNLAARASRRAVKEAREAGVAVDYIENGSLMRRNADNSVTELKKLDRPKLDLDEILCQA